MANAELENVRLTVTGLQIFEEIIIIERAARLAYADPWAALKMLDGLPAPSICSYSSLAVIALCHNSIKGKDYERALQVKFYRKLDEYLPGAEVVTRKIDAGMRPDGFVLWRGCEGPVEVKRGAFDEKALMQLRRYMRHYDCGFGVAVAPYKTCQIPRNVKFVAVQYDPAGSAQ